MEYLEQAIGKITIEKKTKPSAKKAAAVFEAVVTALLDFVAQDDEFAQAVVQTEKTVSDCCDKIMKGVGNSISDVQVYKKAVAFYFPGADVKVQMTIDLCAGVSDDSAGGTVSASEPGKNKAVVTLDLADFL